MITQHHPPGDAWSNRGRTNAHRRWLVLGLIAALLLQPLGLPFAVTAQSEIAATSLEAKLDQKGTIILRDATLVEWLFAIQKEWGIDIIVGNELQKEVVNGAFTDTTLREVLTSILVSRGYGYRQVGKSLLIVRLDDMTIKPDQRTVLLPLEFLDPQAVESSVRLLLSQTGQLQAIPQSRSLFIIDTPEVIERVRQLLDELEANAERSQQREQQPAIGAPNGLGQPAVEGGVDMLEVEERIEIFRPEHLTANALAETIQNLVPDARVTANEEQNRVIVAASPQGLDAAKRILARLDVPPKQVQITAYMYDVNVKVLERLGFNWSNAGKGRINGSGDPQSVLSFDNNTFSTGAAPAPAAGGTGGTGGTGTTGTGTGGTSAATTAASTAVGGLVTLSHLSRHFDLKTVLQALEQTDGARLLARPEIMAYDRTEAKFESVQEIPVQQLTQTQQGGQIGTTQFRKAGITLTVLPHIMDDDSVVMQVTPAFSVLNGFTNGQPIIDSRTATTRLKLKNGEVSVIGGLVRRNEIETVTGVPGLMNLKYFGALFRNHTTTVTESELVVFIQAEVVDASFPGNTRDQMAHSTVNEVLDQIPYATPAPVIASCRDPYCPYHNPRPRFVGDEVGMKPSHSYEYYHPTPSPMYGTPSQPLDGVPTPAEPQTSPAGDPQIGPAGEPQLPLPAVEETDLHLPPPVVIDEMAARYKRLRNDIARLPAVTPTAPRLAERQPNAAQPLRRQESPPSDGRYQPANSLRLPPTAPAGTRFR